MKETQLFQKPMLLLSLLFVASAGFAQVTEQWAKQYDGYLPTAMAVDSAGNVYVTGLGDAGGSYATVKYDSSGNELWAKRHGNGEATSIAVDASGHVYVTGYIYSDATYTDFATIKYDTDGTVLWMKRYNSPENAYDEAHSIAVDALGNVYVTGNSQTVPDSSYGYATVKYDAAGNERWVRRYKVPGGVYNRAAAVAVDASGNVYVTGSSDGIETSNDYATIKYSTVGTELWVKRYHYSGNDEAAALAVDASGNVYVTGMSGGDGSDYATVKYDRNGNELWVARYEGEGNISDQRANSLAIDASGNVYVTGEDRGNYATVKYNTDGTELWAKKYSNGKANTVALDDSGNVYVSGSGFDYGSTFGIVKYNAAGAELWAEQYKGLANGYTRIRAAALVVDGAGNVYVTGSANADYYNPDFNYLTIKYAQGQIKPVLSSFTLINADNDTAIRELKDGDTLDLAALSFRNINIRANTTPDSIGSVVFKLSGAQTRLHTENLVPYALFADNKMGGYYAWKPAEGDYTLTATPYNGAKGSGGKGDALTIHFHVQYRKVSSFTLVNADTDTDIGPLRNGDVIDLSKIGTQNLNIRANTSPDTVGSVVLVLNDNYSRRHTENIAPYAWFADNKQGDYYAWTPTAGNYSLYAIPYELAKGRGRAGTALRVDFSVVTGTSASLPAAPLTKLEQAPAAGEAAVKETLVAMPNPAIGQTTIRFSVPNSGFTALDLYNSKGAPVQRLYQAWAEAGKVYSVPFQRRQLSNGVYMLRTVTGTHTQSYKLVLLK